MPATLSHVQILTVALVIFVFAVAVSQQVVFTLDLVLRILLAEQNFLLNRLRRRDSSYGQAMPVLASVIGHREEPVVFERCLKSYRSQLRNGILVVGIDGVEEADKTMADVHCKVA